jgi:hypothetical protein
MHEPAGLGRFSFQKGIPTRVGMCHPCEDTWVC